MDALGFAVSSALAYILALSYVFRNCACHTTILFGTSHFSATTRHLHVNSITLPVCFWHFVNTLRASQAVEVFGKKHQNNVLGVAVFINVLFSENSSQLN